MAVNQFEVFGVDVRDYGQLWVAAWRDFLFGDDSPVRAALDSQVKLKFADGVTATYQAGREVSGDHVESEVLAVPDELVLSRVLTLPSIAEADLEAALHLEIAACSPFSSDDTAAGWRVTREGEESNLRVDLVIASRSAVVGFLSIFMLLTLMRLKFGPTPGHIGFVCVASAKGSAKQFIVDVSFVPAG